MQGEKRRTIHVRQDFKKPQSAKKRGHEVVLSLLQDSGVKTEVAMMSGATVVGKVVAFDKYTITILDANNDKNVIFKHAIESFVGSEVPAIH